MASVRTPLFIWECPTPESFNSHKNSKPGKCTYKTHSVYLYVHFPEQYFAHACWDYPKPLLAGENDFHLFAVSAPKNPVLFLLFFLKKSCHCGTTFYRYNFVVFFPLHRRFSDGWSTLADPRPPVLIMKTFCIHFHFRRCSALNAKKDVVIWERVLRLFLRSL